MRQTRADDQLWQDLAAYTQSRLQTKNTTVQPDSEIPASCCLGQLQLPPEVTLRLIETYQASECVAVMCWGGISVALTKPWYSALQEWRQKQATLIVRQQVCQHNMLPAIDAA